MKLVRGLCLISMALLTACAAGNCREQRAQERRENLKQSSAPAEGTQNTAVNAEEATAGAMAQAMKESRGSNIMDRVKVYKPDGSLQCGMGQKIALENMKQELGGIKVYSMENTSDRLMHITLCGSPTGRINVYEIDRENLKQAEEKGFRLFE